VLSWQALSRPCSRALNIGHHRFSSIKRLLLMAEAEEKKRKKMKRHDDE